MNISKQKFDLYNRTALKEFRSLNIPLPKTNENEEGGTVILNGNDEIGLYCIVKCNCCDTLDVCRDCVSEEDKQNCLNL